MQLARVCKVVGPLSPLLLICPRRIRRFLFRGFIGQQEEKLRFLLSLNKINNCQRQRITQRHVKYRSNSALTWMVPPRITKNSRQRNFAIGLRVAAFPQGKYLMWRAGRNWCRVINMLPFYRQRPLPEGTYVKFALSHKRRLLPYSAKKQFTYDLLTTLIVSSDTIINSGTWNTFDRSSRDLFLNYFKPKL